MNGTRWRRTLALTGMMVIVMTGCSGDQLSTDELNEVRQANIDLATELAAQTITDVTTGSEGLPLCDDNDTSARFSEYRVVGYATAETVDLLRGEWSDRMQADGWTTREQGAGVEVVGRMWRKDGRILGVRVLETEDSPSGIDISITTVSPCADAGDLPADVKPGDPHFIEPTIDGPTRWD